MKNIFCGIFETFELTIPFRYVSNYDILEPRLSLYHQMNIEVYDRVHELTRLGNPFWLAAIEMEDDIREMKSVT